MMEMATLSPYGYVALQKENCGTFLLAVLGLVHQQYRGVI